MLGAEFLVARLVGPIEAGVGILMLGWSTGLLVALLTRIYGREPA